MSRLAYTYSIIARDPGTGQFGVGVQSHAFASGAVVPWAERGVGAVATQAHVDESYGPLGLNLMRAGKSSRQALAALVAADPDPEIRQVAMIDTQGQIATHTGKRCIASAGHQTGDGFSVQGNLLANPQVVPAMAKAYQDSKGDFTERLLQALEAAQDAGGDVRGMQSASLVVVPSPNDPLRRAMVTNLRVDDHDHPLVEMRRLLTIQRAEEWEAQASHAIRQGDLKVANEYYERLRGLVVGSREPLFWYATTLAKHGHADDALRVFGQVFAIEPRWKELIDRLVVSGDFPNDQGLIEKVRALPTKRATATLG
jgi:uncharacterized Ntn-hydrolase superfamily protein